MCATKTQGDAGAAVTTTTTEGGLGLLDQVIGATKQTERDRAEEVFLCGRGELRVLEIIDDDGTASRLQHHAHGPGLVLRQTFNIVLFGGGARFGERG